MPRPDPGAQVEDVRRRDPRLRQPADQQQLPQMPGIRPVSLRTLLLALQRGRLRGLGQVHLSADPLELLDHEPPARRRFQRDLETLVGEPVKERADRITICRRDPLPRQLTRGRLDPLGRDLRTMLIEPHHDRHQTTSSTPARQRPHVARPRLRTAHRIPSTTVGTSSSIRPAARPQSARAYNAVRRGVPATFITESRQPGHDIFRDKGSHAFASALETRATPNAGLDRRFESVALVARCASLSRVR